MRVTVSQWGNSLGLRLPKAIASALQLAPGSALELRVEDGRPVRVTTDRPGLSGGRVQTGAGPWRTSGEWWSEAGDAWNRDEWDVAFDGGAVCRLFQDRDTGLWFVDGVYD